MRAPRSSISHPIVYGAVSPLYETCSKRLPTLYRHRPRGESYRALHRTYLDPAPSQERAAALLGLPFSTYRRHLKGGIMQVVEILWQREIGGR
jgi:hypothetical protein